MIDVRAATPDDAPDLAELRWADNQRALALIIGKEFEQLLADIGLA